jgi:hypothetical protein
MTATQLLKLLTTIVNDKSGKTGAKHESFRPKETIESPIKKLP